MRRSLQKLGGTEGVDFVRCRICGDHRRVISGRHLSKHGIDRETYMEECALSPDELIAKDVRRLQSSRRDYRPYGKRDWIQAIRELHKVEGTFLRDGCKKSTVISTFRELGFSETGTTLCALRDLIQRRCGGADSGTKNPSLRRFVLCGGKTSRSPPTTR
jgi:hypothetical protein